MTGPLLSYESPPAGRPSGLRTGTWIYLLVLGILYGVGGLCMATGMVMVLYLMAKGGGGAGSTKFLIIVTVAVFLVMVGCGVTYLWSALALRRGSRAAAVTALVISIMNAAGILLLMTVMLIATIASHSADLPQLIMGLAVYLVAAAANGVAAFLLVRVLREIRGQERWRAI